MAEEFRAWSLIAFGVALVGDKVDGIKDRIKVIADHLGKINKPETKLTANQKLKSLLNLIKSFSSKTQADEKQKKVAGQKAGGCMRFSATPKKLIKELQSKGVQYLLTESTKGLYLMQLTD